MVMLGLHAHEEHEFACVQQLKEAAAVNSRPMTSACDALVCAYLQPRCFPTPPMSGVARVRAPSTLDTDFPSGPRRCGGLCDDKGQVAALCVFSDGCQDVTG